MDSLWRFEEVGLKEKMENLENENENLRAEIVTLRRENATLNATVDRLFTLVESLLAKQTPSHPPPPQPSLALLHGKEGPQKEKGDPHSDTTFVPVFRENPPVQVQVQQYVNQGQQEKKKRIHFDPIPVTYTELYPLLISKNLVRPRQPHAMPKKLPWWYKPEASCAYHQGAPGHDLERCCTFKAEVQKLVQAGILTFQGTVVRINQTTNHQVSSVDGKGECSRTQQQKRTYFEPIPMTYSQLYHVLIQRRLITPRGYDNPPPNPVPTWYNQRKHCAFHKGAAGHDLEGCMALKVKVRELVKAGILNFKDVGSNVKTNPMPNHTGASASMMGTDQ